MTRCSDDTSRSKTPDTSLDTKCYYMLTPNTTITVTHKLGKNVKIEVTLDRTQPYAHNLSYRLPAAHLLALQSKTSAVLYNGQQNKTTQLNPSDYYNLFGDSDDSKLRKAKLKAIPKPPEATSVSIALIHSGDFPLVDFAKHLKFYFKSTKILYPGHIFALNIPRIVPKNVDLETWLTHISHNSLFVQQTYPVHFRVSSATLGDDNIQAFFSISSESTTLYQVSDEHSRLPSSIPFPRIDMFYKGEIEMALKTLQLQAGVLFPVIFSGERGSRKTDIIHNIGGYIGVGVFPVRGIHYCGEAPGSLEAKFKLLAEQIKLSIPCLIHFDHLELLGRTRDGSTSDARVLLALRELFSAISILDVECGIFVVGTCSDTDKVLMEVKHLFNSHVILDKRKTPQISTFMRSFLKFDNTFDLDKLVSDKLSQVSFRKVLKFVDNLQDQMGLGLNDNHIITQSQCEEILADLQIVDTKKPSSIPETSWADIGGVDVVRREVEETIEMPLKYPGLFGQGLKRSGLLLYGEPGCGKTMVARAIASQCNLHFISIQGPELLNSFVGQSEENVRKVFEKARQLAPTVLFFDEIDAIAPRRKGGVIDRVLAQILSEMDGITDGGDVFMVGATNRPELLDPAITRPGRLDKKVEVSVGSDVDSRVQVFEALSRNLKLSKSVCFRTLSEMSGRLTGAECYGVLLEGCYKAIERCIKSGEKMVLVTQNDLISVIMK